MKSLIIKRSIVLDGHKTSVSLEDAFWQALKKIYPDSRRIRRTPLPNGSIRILPNG